jgi:hypothetical protein
MSQFTFVYSHIPNVTTRYNSISNYFPKLQQDSLSYITNNQFKSRFREFGQFKYKNNKFERVSINNLFNPKLTVHTKHNNSKLSEIEDNEELNNSLSNFLEELSNFTTVDIKEYDIGINIVRVTADQNNFGNPAPSLHQDNYDYSLHINFARQNVCGGTSLLASGNQPEDIFLEKDLSTGEFVFFNDRKIFHTASPVSCKVGGFDTYRDMIIIDFLKQKVS